MPLRNVPPGCIIMSWPGRDCAPALSDLYVICILHLGQHLLSASKYTDAMLSFAFPLYRSQAVVGINLSPHHSFCSASHADTRFVRSSVCSDIVNSHAFVTWTIYSMSATTRNAARQIEKDKAEEQHILPKWHSTWSSYSSIHTTEVESEEIL